MSRCRKLTSKMPGPLQISLLRAVDIYEYPETAKTRGGATVYEFVHHHK